MIVRITLYIIATWLIAAHFLRAGSLILTALCLATPLLFFIHQRWSLRLLQVGRPMPRASSGFGPRGILRSSAGSSASPGCAPPSSCSPSPP